MPELHRRSHLAALDQIRVRLENGINLLRIGNLLSLEHPTAGLIDDAVTQSTVALDLLSQLLDRQRGKQDFAAHLPGTPQRRSRPFHDLLGNADELAILAGLPLAPLRYGHPLESLHPPACCARAVAKTLDTPLDHCPLAGRPDE